MQDRWAIGYRHGSFSPHGQSLDPLEESGDALKASGWLHPPAGRSYADPFLTQYQGQPWVFFEDFDGVKGHISASPLLHLEVHKALEQDFHLSYPGLIEWESELFCIPEQHQSNQVVLYRCLSFPDRWQIEAVLLDGFAGVDPTVIWSGGKWWMWVGDQHRRARDQTFLFVAPTLTGPWHEHSQSPAISRPDLARPGGQPWLSSKGWMRPAQNRTRTYGGGLLVYVVESLDQHTYHETEWTRWEPDPTWPYPDGLHHLCMGHGWTVWDAKRIVEEL